MHSTPCKCESVCSSRGEIFLSSSLFLSLYLKIHSLQELLNGARLLPISLTPLAPLRLSSPRHPVIQYLDVYELEVAYPVVHDAFPQPALIHLYHIDYVPLLKQCSHGHSQEETFRRDNQTTREISHNTNIKNSL